jgi:hypothetical protein
VSIAPRAVADLGAKPCLGFGKSQARQSRTDEIRDFGKRLGLVPASTATIRFSTDPSAPTSTASARCGDKWDQAELPQPKLLLRGKDDARRMAETRQRRRSGRERILDRLVAADLPLDLGALARVGSRGLHDAVDEQPQPGFGRHSTRRGVRMGEQAALLQLLHHSPDRGRRQADASGQCLRPHRSPPLEIGVDHQPENLAHPVGEFGDRRF